LGRWGTDKVSLPNRRMWSSSSWVVLQLEPQTEYESLAPADQAVVLGSKAERRSSDASETDTGWARVRTGRRRHSASMMGWTDRAGAGIESSERLED
jgi:hypothetical protein